jgi:hypothetical protein
MDEEDGADCLRIRTMSQGKNSSVNSYFSYAAHDRLAGRPRGPYRKLRILQAWAEGAGRTSLIFRRFIVVFRMSPSSCCAHARRASCKSCTSLL